MSLVPLDEHGDRVAINNFSTLIYLDYLLGLYRYRVTVIEGFASVTIPCHSSICLL